MTTTTATTTPVITSDIQKRVVKIKDEQNLILKQRIDVVDAFWIARVAQQHLLMLGPGGTGKSMLVRDGVSHIEGAKLFEVALDETTDPGQVFGPPDIPAMVKEGKQRRVPTDMLPEATDAFVDEIFNGNGPVLHSLMPAMNERIFHNNGMPTQIPLRMLAAGTNKLNADSDLAAFFDRLHHRHVVGYLNSRSDQADMIGQAIARMTVAGRGTTTSLAAAPTMVTLEELDQAHKESLTLSVPDPIMDLFLDLRSELREKGVHISDRRQVEGMAAVLANGWIRGHEEIKAGDLDVLANMWWVVQDQISEVRQAVLAVANPGEKAAIELTKDFQEIEGSMNQAQRSGSDKERMRRLGVESIRNVDKLIAEAESKRALAEGAGASTKKLDDLLDRAGRFKLRVGEEVFGLDVSSAASLARA